MIKWQYLKHALSDFDEIWYVDGQCVPESGVVVKTETESKNEPSAAAILNFVFGSYIGWRANCLHRISYVWGKQAAEWSKFTSTKIQDGRSGHFEIS